MKGTWLVAIENPTELCKTSGVVPTPPAWPLAYLFCNVAKMWVKPKSGESGRFSIMRL